MDTEDYTDLYKKGELAVPGSNWSQESDVPPVLTKTWFHTGYYLDRNRISRLYETEYYYEDLQAWLLEDTILPDGLTAEEEREACRALKGSMLRQEVYAIDGAEDETGNAIEKHPYTASESNYSIQLLQSEKENPFCRFSSLPPRESLSYHYERNPKDPRIAHTVNLKVDTFGNTTHAVSIVYPRRPGDDRSRVHPEEQRKLNATATENRLLHKTEEESWYRHSLAIESTNFELQGLGSHFEWENEEKNNKLPFSFLKEALFEDAVEGSFSPEFNPGIVIDYPEAPPEEGIRLRLLGHSRSKYYQNDLIASLPFGEIESLAIPYETYKLGFTSSVLAQPELEGKITPTILEEGGYKTSVELFEEREEKWWIPSGVALFEPMTATENFYLPVGSKDPFGNETSLAYDDYNLLNQKHDGHARQHHQCRRSELPGPAALPGERSNANRSQVVFDTRGMVIATAVMGKERETDSGPKWEIQLPDMHQLLLQKGEPPIDDILTDPHKYLKGATAFFYYDLFAWMRDKAPNFAIGLSREIHFHDGGTDCRVQRAIIYADGFGREILSKVQAEGGDAPEYDEHGQLIFNEDGSVSMINTTDFDHLRRWVGKGRTIYNNKGKPGQTIRAFL